MFKKMLIESILNSELLEELSALEHEQWVEWSKSVADDIKDDERLERWKTLWVDYDELDDENMENDREYARKVLEILAKYTNMPN